MTSKESFRREPSYLVNARTIVNNVNKMTGTDDGLSLLNRNVLGIDDDE